MRLYLWNWDSFRWFSWESSALRIVLLLAFWYCHIYCKMGKLHDWHSESWPESECTINICVLFGPVLTLCINVKRLSDENTWKLFRCKNRGELQNEWTPFSIFIMTENKMTKKSVRRSNCDISHRKLRCFLDLLCHSWSAFQPTPWRSPVKP